MHRTAGHLGQIGFGLLLGLLVVSTVVAGAEKAIPPERANPRLAPSLQLLAEIATSNPSALQPRAEDSGIVLDGDRIDVIIEPTSGRVANLDEAAIRALGGTVEAKSETLIRASVPVDRLLEVADRVSGVAYIREPYKPRPLVVTSQGVALTGASVFHSAGYTGVGVKVAIIDLGFDGLADAQAAGELAHVAYTWNYITGSSGVETTGEVHGTAVAEIVEDMAPGASLYLLLIGDEVDLANAAQYCIDHGIRVINHSVGWYNTDYYDGTGDVAGVANDARDNNILWVNAAGNEGSDGHWQGAFTDTDGDGFLDFGTGSDYVDGDTRDEGARIYASSGDVVRVYMTWNDWTTSDQDYDLYLYNSSGTIVASSTGYQGGYQQPTEAIYYSVTASGYYEIVIKNYAAPAKPEIEFFAYLDSGADPGMQHHIASSSIAEPANSAKVLAAGAIARYNWTSGPIESFSSRGPSNTSLYAASITKPDLCGVDGVSSYTYGSFYGTSAASPHVAGAAALLLSEDPTRTADQLQNLLEVSAIDMGTSGKDNTYGSGRLNLELSPAEAIFRVDAEGNTYADGAFYGSQFHIGSADVAEWVSVSEGVGPGDVLELDPANPGCYRKSSGACSALVAGVVSTVPGVVLAAESGDSSIVVESGASSGALLALVGVVPVKVTDEGGPIRPGDLLVPSSTPGCAMRWNPGSETPCGFVGKALEPLDGSEGLISILLM
ncbi:MAG: S8 family serine peptidase [Thermotogota bacterium]